MAPPARPADRSADRSADRPAEQHAGISKSTPSRVRDASFTACLTCRSKKVKCSGGNPCQYCSKRGLPCQATAPGQRRAYSVTRIQELESRLAEYERSMSASTSPPAQSAAAPPPAHTSSHSHSRPHAPPPHSSHPSLPPPPPPLPPPPPPSRSQQPAQAQAQAQAQSQAQSQPASQCQTPASTTSTGHGLQSRTAQTPTQTAPGAASKSGHTKRNLLSDVDKEPSSRNDSPDSTIFTDVALSSSHTFGSRLENIFNRRSTASSGGPVTPSSTHAAHIAPAHPPRPPGFPVLPSEAEAFQLLDVTMLHLCHIQHHFDTRVFADKLSVFYSARMQYDAQYFKSPWVVEMLLVLAVGKLLVGRFEYEDDEGRMVSEDMPGAEMFKYAHANLPNLSDMLNLGASGVELLALTAMYLQNSGRKEEAYVYISTALRLCLTHGYHMASTKKPLMQSERVHINRLWWTIYMQERRVAAATGHCSSITDEAIEIPLPSSAPGFFHPGALCTTIKIARVTGHIMRVLYGPGLRTEEQFVPNVQEIVRQLYDISKEIPAELGTEYHGVDADVSFRTVATLHLMLYHIVDQLLTRQTIILTIRPILLHVAQIILSGRGFKPDQLKTSPLGKLSRTCTEAARRSLRISLSFLSPNMANTKKVSFGFFDSDALFSVAFILILAAILDSQEPTGPRIAQSPGLDDAMGVMQHIISRGNRHALERTEAVKRIWFKVSEYLASQEAASASTSAVPGAQPALSASAAAVAPPTAPNGMAYDDVQPQQQQQRPQQQPRPPQFQDQQQQGVDTLFNQEAPIHTDLLHDISHLWQVPADLSMGAAGMQQQANSMVLDERSYFSLYVDQDWTFGGEGEADFAELSRQILEWS
ncbi:hypothetical protein TD95_000204 [Thielaviopsis punctulata]|uniref:Zn(2)-C6 fungal-type domain-containing protein n=1 Tax=Thielaviopsis punctulata TaxID=72032 RepID=A0A0F4ZDQ4_9PEZI|nr:hypothetical protein TD95_000204 [Thielaviopsis punctulata]